MKALGVDKAASALKRTSKTSAAPAKRKREPVPDSAPSRRSSRARAEVSYKEPTMREFEEAFAVDTSAEDARGAEIALPASRSGYASNAAPRFPSRCSTSTTASFATNEPASVFKDHPSFAPNLTPKQVIQAGSRAACTSTRGCKAGIKGRDVAVTHAEFPKHWFAGLPPDAYPRVGTRRTEQVPVGWAGPGVWEEHGWIIDQDPRGVSVVLPVFRGARRTRGRSRGGRASSAPKVAENQPVQSACTPTSALTTNPCRP